MFTHACCLVVGLGLGLGLGLGFSVRLVSCYAHVFVLLSIVIVTLQSTFGNNLMKMLTDLNMASLP